jgi:hypothetical protein
MWQADSFDPTAIARELDWAEKIGMTLLRVYLHDLLWQDDAAGLCTRLEQFLTLTAARKMKVMLTLFDDCWRNQDFGLGVQPAPQKGVHNSGWIQSPGDAAADDPTQRRRLEKYVRELLTRFGADARILAWDLYNEPGNRGRGSKSLPLLSDAFRWASEITPCQPLTVGLWDFTAEFSPINHFILENSPLVTFHCYEPPNVLRERLNFLRYLANDRPLICTEYMARTRGSTFQDCLPIFKEYEVGAINWGLVAGKTNTIYPWGWAAEKGEPELYFHDVFHADGSFLYPAEGEFFAKLAAPAAAPR